MKNVTIALDDTTHRKARIRAAELGTSLSALVKDYLNGLAAEDLPASAPSGVREMHKPFKQAEPAVLRKPGRWADVPKTPDWLIDIMEGTEDDFSDPLPFDESQLLP